MNLHEKKKQGQTYKVVMHAWIFRKDNMLKILSQGLFHRTQVWGLGCATQEKVQRETSMIVCDPWEDV